MERKRTAQKKKKNSRPTLAHRRPAEFKRPAALFFVVDNKQTTSLPIYTPTNNNTAAFVTNGATAGRVPTLPWGGCPRHRGEVPPIRYGGHPHILYPVEEPLVRAALYLASNLTLAWFGARSVTTDPLAVNITKKKVHALLRPRKCTRYIQPLARAASQVALSKMPEKGIPLP